MAKNPFVETFQQALIDAGYPAKVNGVWDRQTIDTMGEFAEDHGFPKGNWPTAEIMALLEIHPSGWWTIAKAAGAPKDVLDDISAVAKKQIALQLIEGTKQAFEPAKSEVSRVGVDLRTGMPTPMVPAGRVGDRVPYTPAPGTAPAPGVSPDRYVQTPEGDIVPAEGALPTEPLLAEKKFQMPTWGWVAIGLGGAAVIAAVAGVVIVRARKPEPAMAGCYGRDCYY
jgi:hypothetical protein